MRLSGIHHLARNPTVLEASHRLAPRSSPASTFHRCAQLVLTMLLFLSTRAALAQDSTTGALRGRAQDPTGAVLAGAELRLADLATGRELTLKTGTDGSFSAISLIPGTYVLQIRASGFSPRIIPGLTVALGAITDLHTVTLSVGASEVITVVATPDDAAITAQTNLLSAEQIDNLPLDGRRWQSFARLTPQASPTDTSLDLLSFRALAPTQNSTRLDGLTNDQSYSAAPRGAGQNSGPEVEDEQEDTTPGDRSSNRGYTAGSGPGRTPGMEYTVPEAAVREFRVTAQNDSAVFGHAAGGTVTTVTRAGTDDLHGRASFLVRSSAFAAADPFAVATHYTNGAVTSAIVKPHDLREQFGGALGGPILPGRLFFFYALDLQRRGFPGVSSPENPAFYALTPVQTDLLGNRGVSTAQIRTALTYLDRLTGTVQRRHDQAVNFARLDFAPRDRDHFSLSYNRAHSSSPGGGRTAPVVSRGVASFGNVTVRIDAAFASWTHTLNAHLANELHAGYSRDLHRETAQTPLPQEPAISVGALPPEVAIGPDGLIFGTPAAASGGPNPDEHRGELAEILTWNPRHHVLQLGGELSVLHDHVHALTNTEGTFHYDSGNTGGYAGGLVDWITDYTFNVNATPNGGCPSIHARDHLFCFRSFTQSFGGLQNLGPDAHFNTQEWAGFVQDDWRLGQALSFSAGLRYEYELLPLPQRPNADLDRDFGTVGATSIFPEDRNNAGPRLGLAYAPFHSRATVLRVGYGLYFGRLPGATVRTALENTALPSSVTRIRITPSVETACPQVANQGFGYPCAFVASPPSGVVGTTTATVFDRRFRLPASQQGRVAIEQTLPKGIALTLSGLLSLTRQLPNSTDLNIAPTTQTRSFVLAGGTSLPGVNPGYAFSLPLYTARVDPAYGPVTDILSNANANYTGAVLELEQRTRSLQLRASFTWSKSLDFGENPGAIPPTNGQYDPFNVRYDKGISGLNVPQKVVVSAIWTPRPFRPSAWERTLASGWTVSPIFIASSGRPYSYNVFGGSRLSGGHESLNGAGGAVYLPTVGRNVLRLPEQLQADLRLGRQLLTRDSLRLRLTAEVFNVPNHRNLTAVSERAFLVGTPANGVYPLTFQDAATIASEGLNTIPFGQPTSASQGQSRERQAQLGLNLTF